MSKFSSIMKVAALTGLVAGTVSVTEASTFASSQSQNGAIPTRMQAGTVIEYDSSNQMVIIEKGTPIVSPIAQQNTEKRTLSKEEQEKLAKEEELVKQIKAEAKNLPVYNIENPAPKPGLKVVYDGEGYIKKFIYPEGISTMAYKALPRGTRKPAGTYTYGKNNNKITIAEKHVLGEGRFTNFTDTEGESENTLKKGDAATKGDIDNPKYDTVLDARNLENDKFANVTKRDNGELPDATLDIWKDGVEDFGVKWSSSVSFKGRYYYSF
ncbi:hypothetical protein [Paenibacillus elgii]|uniref:Uncharacterized protein n=1 Tax=Paenibacillus elgii TaxID=189691 RepID=A0A163TD51_9BACL|nr:hypothetical protein [Paenibacillus elgii]KZE71604.1 hypothetical protein AV654_05200 [Paenibacillus elgii]NEN84070.1 hypothetical protein [Paenibacillus elgii]